MIPVFLAQLAKERRHPVILIVLIAASVAGTVIFTGGTQAPTEIAIFSEGTQSEAIEEKWETLLNHNSELQFVVSNPEDARESVQQGQADLAIRLTETDYTVITSSTMPDVAVAEQHVRSVFEQEAVIESALAQSVQPELLRTEIESAIGDPVMQMNVSSLGGDELSGYDMKTQLIFAFTLLTAMFMIGFRVNNILKDKVYGLWDRMILSPVTKTGMYTAYITYAFFIGFVQILIVMLIFRYFMNVELGDRFDLLLIVLAIFTFSMVSVATLLTGLVKKPELFYAIYPSVIPMIPIISGAYMVPGTITNPVLLFIGDLFPVSHAMDALLDIVMYNATLQDVTQPIMMMILIGVISMGIGVNLVERRSV
ncbi:hypothetical protein KP77_11940 [Jeotgalibacillus alimentarius]|uniref:ABC transmembrane type-2 domain-containing protein n=1 Tax=Jeotgalibacillus alimentarius TaxID=135826 RepID=A0A0C2VRX8_9BACL|nr:ABC transporter permease [Jeotgalibacillus alimentarius]KIL51682.1 hypothetical protein KP77_11940 [Jeotgalibacillus alimentarius]